MPVSRLDPAFLSYMRTGAYWKPVDVSEVSNAMGRLEQPYVPPWSPELLPASHGVVADRVAKKATSVSATSGRS